MHNPCNCYNQKGLGLYIGWVGGQRARTQRPIDHAADIYPLEAGSISWLVRQCQEANHTADRAANYGGERSEPTYERAQCGGREADHTEQL